MRIELGGGGSAAVIGLHRAAEAAVRAAPGVSTIARRRHAALLKPRFRAMVRATNALAPKIAAAVDAARATFRSAIGLREASGRDEADLDAWLAAVDAMSPTQLEHALQAAYADMYEDGVLNVRAEVDASDFELHSARAIAALDQYALSFSTEVLIAEKAALKALIRDSLTEGWDVRELARQIGAFFDDGIHRIDDDGSERVVDLDSWSRTVARTETARAHNAGLADGYAAAGVSKIIWVAADDERTCPICSSLDGTVVTLGEPFFGTDVEQPPEHPNCRCTTVGLSAVTADLVRQAA